MQDETKRIRELFQENVVPSYSRFDIALKCGQGSYVWDANGKRYLDLGGGIAVCSLGHAHPEMAKALSAQSQTLIHVSNLTGLCLTKRLPALSSRCASGLRRGQQWRPEPTRCR